MVRLQYLALSVPLLVSTTWAQSCSDSYLNLSSMAGFFLQDDPATNPSTFDYAEHNFGIIDRTYPSDELLSKCGEKTLWQRFVFHVKQLNKKAPTGTSYKVLFLGRHGEGYHNAAESFYGTPAWNCYWSELDGNGTAIFADAHLTPKGEAEAFRANAFWASQIANEKQPPPQSYYVSPLTRAMDTANLTFSTLSLPADRPFRPTVKELFREGVSIHTCDRRSSRTYIHGRFPDWTIEAGFAETDPLWNGTYSESSDAEDVRSRTALNEVFESDEGQLISVTAHSGEIASLLRVLGHRAFSLSTGQIIVTLVKAEIVRADPFPSTTEPWRFEATCTAPPVTSLATGGCVCSSTAAIARPTAI